MFKFIFNNKKMYTILNHIIKLFTSYSSLFHLYTIEFSDELSYIEFINSIILILIFIFIFFRFLIKRYTFKIVCFFILKRIFFAILFFYLFYFFSGFTYCETPINKGIKSFLNTDTKKYLCIATVTITGCFLGYKYLPLWYSNVKSHNAYLTYLDKKNFYDLNLKIYLESKQVNMQLKKKSLDDFNLMCKNFTDSILNFINLNLKFKDSISIFEKDKDIRILNSSFSNYVLPRAQETLNRRLYNVFINYNKSLKIINDLKTNSKVYNFNYELLEKNHLIFLEEVIKLKKFYEKDVNNSIVEIKNYSNIYSTNYFSDFEFRTKHLKTFNELETLVDNTLNCSLFLLTFVENILESPVVVNNFDQLVNFNTILKPKEIYTINYPLENLDGLKFVSINLGYIFFYPILYSSNKILGTNNPLSFIAFKKAIAFFIHGGGFF